jgi:hypothetical protein
LNEDNKRIALIAGAIGLALLSIGAGAVIALSHDSDRTQSSSPTETPEPSATSEPSASQTPGPSPSGSSILADGRHFVYVKSALRRDDGSTTVRFDLAYFYRGDRALEEAAERGDEVLNDYYIVNDNPKLRTLPLADDVKVKYIPESLCCELQQGNIDAWLEAVLETNPTDYPGKNVPWWFTVEGGEITRIGQQYLP